MRIKYAENQVNTERALAAVRVTQHAKTKIKKKMGEGGIPTPRAGWHNHTITGFSALISPELIFYFSGPGNAANQTELKIWYTSTCVPTLYALVVRNTGNEWTQLVH